jgi:hypothetical protein
LNPPPQATCPKAVDVEKIRAAAMGAKRMEYLVKNER